MASLLSVQTFILICFVAATGLLIATAWMLRSQRVSRRFQDLEVESRGLVQPLRKMLPRFRHELARGRRYDRTMSALVIRVREPLATVPTNGKAAHAAKDVAPIWAIATGSLIQDNVRDSDLVGWDVAMNRYVAFLPETNLRQSQEAANRLVRLIHDHVPVQVSAGVSEFKLDGVTVEDLLARAAERCDQIGSTAQPATEPAARVVEGSRAERNIIELREPNQGVSISS